MALRSFFIFGMAVLIAFYGYCLYLSVNPKVGDAYRLYYIEKISSSPHTNSFNYELGEKIITSRSDSSHHYLGKGWSKLEGDCTWSDSKDTYLLFHIDNQPTTDLEMIVKVQGFVHSKHPRQTADIYVNNIFMETWIFISAEAIEKRLLIPKEILIKNDLLTIKIINKDRISLHKLGLSDDKRKLGICLHWLQINLISK